MKRNYKYYCKDYENIENYEKAKANDFKGWDCHHRLETHTSDGERRLVDITQKELIALNMYYNRPSSELVFLPSSEHISLHNKEKTYFKGKHHTEESKKKMSLSKKGKYTGEDNPFYGKTHSDETRMRLSAASKGNTYAKGMHWYNNGKETKYCYECPPGFVPGRLQK